MTLGLHESGKEYYSLGIIGAQSSGKSTLLNYMFNTGFDVLDSKKHRKQTTKGIWVSRALDSHLLVFDIEGSDSRERWEGKSSFERSTAFFGLVLSNILIINIWTHDFGRFSAANYEIIKIIFEINLRLFNQESTKQLLFVVRDFDSESENFDYIKETISKDLVKIWQEIKKPAQFENLKASEFFNAEFFPLPHFKHEQEAFKERTHELADRLTNPENEHFYYKGIDTSTNIPMDGLYMYIQRVWQSIQENKELNLPSQKIMVSNYRCSEVKRETLDMAKPEIQELIKNVQKEFKPDLKKSVQLLLKKSIKIFKNQTDQYDDEIVEDKEKELEADLLRDLQDVSEIQERKIEEMTFQKFENKLIEYKAMRNFSKMIETCKDLKKEITQEFRRLIEEASISDDKEKEFENFNSRVEGRLREFMSSRINVLLKKIQNEKYKSIESFLTRLFSQLEPNFWDDFCSEFNQLFDNYEEEVFSLRNDCEELKGAFDENIINEMKMELYLLIKSNMNIKKNNFTKYVMDRFRRNFMNTESGIRRNWNNIDEDRINEIFIEAKDKIITVLDTAQTAVFPEMLTEQAHSLFDKDEIANLKLRIEEKMNDTVEGVFNKKYNKNSLGNVPWWLWLVLVYFMYDDVIKMASSPTVLFFLVITAGGAGYLAATGQMGQFVALLNTVVRTLSMIVKNTGLFKGAATTGAAKAKID